MAKKFLSREEYLDKQRQAIIEQSIENSNNRTTPAAPYVLKFKNEKEWKDTITSAINFRKEKIKNYTVEDLLNTSKKFERENFIKQLKELEEELNKGYKEELCAGPSCIYTATDNYGEKYRVSGNRSFRANPAKYGFKEINLNDIKPGDIIQDFTVDNIPKHAITFMGYKDNKAIFNYSSGGDSESSIRKNAHYPFEFDDKNPMVHLDGTNNNKLKHAAAAYRFIGTEDDNKLWNENYNKERSDWSKQVIEELKQVPAIQLPNRVVSMKKYGGKQKQNKLQVKNGIAQPLGKGYYLMNGPSHEQGGIDIGKNLEVEGGEIVKLNPKSIKVLSNAKIMGDMTPAEYALGGLKDGTFEDRYNKGFKYQEKFKDINGLNDDGTKAKFGKIINFIKDKSKQINRYLRGEFMDFAQNVQNDDENGHVFGPSVEGHQDYKNNKYPDPSQTAYLFNEDEFNEAMLNSGYIKGVAGDYGLVKKAVGNRNLPVYQKRKDDEYIGNLKAVANPHMFLKDNNLEHAGPYPTALYVDDAGNVFQKGWNLQDYGQDSEGNRGVIYPYFKQKAANLLDIIGNPFVRTTGLTKLNDEDIQILLIGDTNKNLIKDIVNSGNKTLLNHYNKFKNDRLNFLYKSVIEDEYYKYNNEFNEALFEEYKQKYPYDKFIKEIDKYYSKDELENLKIYKLGGQMKKKYKIGGNVNVLPTGKKVKADLGLQETLNKFGQHFLYPKVKPAVVTANVSNSKTKNYKSFGDQLHMYTNMVELPGYMHTRDKIDYMYPYWNYNVHEKINFNRGNVPIPYRLEEEVISPEVKSESSPNQTQSNNATISKVQIQERTTPTANNNSTPTTTKVATTPIQENTKSFTPTTTNNFKGLNLDFFNEITNPDGFTTNLRTGQTYFKNWNKVRRTPYSLLNLKTGKTEYAGFINPYGSEIQSAVYNNGPQGREERTTKERLLNTGDWINIGINSAGALTNLITGLATPNIKYARMRDSIPIMAPKINSNVNTTAEESAIDEVFNDEMRAINENTASSKTALNRKRNAALRKRQAKVKVRSAAENTRRDLINKGNILKGEYDKFNIQRQEQVDAYNRQAKAAEFNANRTKVGDAITGFVSDLSQGASTITNTLERREADRVNTVLSYMGNPEVNPNEFGKGFDEIYEKLYGRKPSRYIRKKYNKK